MREAITLVSFQTGSSAEGVTTTDRQEIATLPALVKQVSPAAIAHQKSHSDFEYAYVAQCVNDPRIKHRQYVEYRDKVLWVAETERDENINQMKIYLALRAEGTQ